MERVFVSFYRVLHYSGANVFKPRGLKRGIFLARNSTSLDLVVPAARPAIDNIEIYAFKREGSRHGNRVKQETARGENQRPGLSSILIATGSRSGHFNAARSIEPHRSLSLSLSTSMNQIPFQPIFACLKNCNIERSNTIISWK